MNLAEIISIGLLSGLFLVMLIVFLAVEITTGKEFTDDDTPSISKR